MEESCQRLWWWKATSPSQRLGDVIRGQASHNWSLCATRLRDARWLVCVGGKVYQEGMMSLFTDGRTWEKVKDVSFAK